MTDVIVIDSWYEGQQQPGVQPTMQVRYYGPYTVATALVKAAKLRSIEGHWQSFGELLP